MKENKRVLRAGVPVCSGRMDWVTGLESRNCAKPHGVILSESASGALREGWSLPAERVARAPKSTGQRPVATPITSH